MVGLFGREISPTQGIYLHSTAQQRKTKTDIHAVSVIRTHVLSDQAIKAYASDGAAIGTGFEFPATSGI
jgi:hypothetical protein